MLPFVELDASRVRLAPGRALLRARDYQDYLSANRLVEAARERAAEIEREAHEVYQEQKRLGWEAGLEEARLRQAGLIQETLLRCNRYYRQVDRQLGEVVLQAVRKVLRHYDAVELTLAATREALALVSNQKQVILHVQPEQLAAVREQVARVLKDFPRWATWKWSAMPGWTRAVASWKPRSGSSTLRSTASWRRCRPH